MTEQTLARARAGDEDAFRELTDPYRRELQLHVYRIVGSVHDAEDLLQETLLSAWRALAQFERELFHAADERLVAEPALALVAVSGALPVSGGALGSAAKTS